MRYGYCMQADNISLLEKRFKELSSPGPAGEGWMTAVALHRAILDLLGVKISSDHFTHFCKKLERKFVEGKAYVTYIPLVECAPPPSPALSCPSARGASREKHTTGGHSPAQQTRFQVVTPTMNSTVPGCHFLYS